MLKRASFALTVTMILITLGAAGQGQPARAEVPAVLKQVPADFQIVIVIKSMDRLQEKGTALAKTMGLADQFGDLTELLAQSRGLNFAQIDRGKPLVLMIPVVPSAERAPTDNLHGAMLLAVKDFKAFTADNKAETKGDERVITTTRGVPLVTRQLGDYAILADNATMADRIAKITDKSLADALSAEEQELLAASEAMVHINGAAVFAALRPVLEKELRAAGDPTMARSAMDVVQLAGKDCESLDLGLVLGDDGVEFRGVLLAKEKSSMAEAFATADKPADPLVANVPLGNFLLAGGKGPGVKRTGEFHQRITEAVKKASGNATGDAELAGGLIDSRLKLDKLMKNVSFSLTPGTTEGKVSAPVALTVVAEVTDGAAAREAAHEYLDALTKLKFPTGEGAKVAALTLIKDDDIAGVKVEKLIGKAELLLPGLGDEAQMLPKIFGEDQLSLRVAVRNNMLVMTLGGGADALKAAFKAIDDKVTGPNDPGIAKVKSHRVAQPTIEVYVAVDRLANVGLGVVGVLAGVDLPAFPKVVEPMVVSVGLKDRAASVRAFVPASLLEAGGKFWGEMKKQREGGGGGPPFDPRRPGRS